MTRWLAEYVEEGKDGACDEVAFRIGRDGDELIAEWIGVARLVARRDGTAHRLEPATFADPREINKIERGGVQLLLRHLAGKIALHGAAVVRGERAVILLTRSGGGKSTLAAALCARDGVALLSDDAVAIDPAQDAAGYVVTALERLHWLDADARAALDAAEAEPEEGKRPVAAVRFGERGALVALVDLVFCDGPTRLVRATPLEAMAALVPQAVRFILDEPEVHRREIDILACLVDVVPVFRLERRRSFALLSESCDAVLHLLGAPPGAIPGK